MIFVLLGASGFILALLWRAQLRHEAEWKETHMLPTPKPTPQPQPSPTPEPTPPAEPSEPIEP